MWKSIGTSHELERSSFSARRSCFRQSHILFMGQVGSSWGKHCGSTFVRHYALYMWNKGFWSTFMRIQTSDLPIFLSMTIRIQALDLKTSPSALLAGQKKKFEWTICEDSNFIPSGYKLLLWQSRNTNLKVNSLRGFKPQTLQYRYQMLYQLSWETKMCVELFRKLQSRETCEMKVLVDFHEDSNLRSTDFAINDNKDSNLRP